MERHFTSTVFVVDVSKKAILLHWHEKVLAWLPPGGHIEPNEDPIQTAKREVFEETGLYIEIVKQKNNRVLEGVSQIEPPYTILIEIINDPETGQHEHIDLIYFGQNIKKRGIPDNWQWVDKHQLEISSPLTRTNGSKATPPQDVRILGIQAINHVTKKSNQNNVK